MMAQGGHGGISAPKKPVDRTAAFETGCKGCETALAAALSAQSRASLLLLSRVASLHGNGCLRQLVAGPGRGQRDRTLHGDTVLATQARRYLQLAVECAWASTNRRSEVSGEPRADLPPAGAGGEDGEVHKEAGAGAVGDERGQTRTGISGAELGMLPEVRPAVKQHQTFLAIPRNIYRTKHYGCGSSIFPSWHACRRSVQSP